MTAPSLSESLFRQYEIALANIVSNYPNPTVFHPVALSPLTYAARLRDVADAFIDHAFPTTRLSHAKFSTIWPSASVMAFNNSVTISFNDTTTNQNT